MDQTSDFVNKVHDTQAKAEGNKQRQGKGAPAKQLGNKQHATNK
ncbi:MULTISPECIES: DUF4023 domain-containing protein [Paenibacillus]|uniref:DUF4023 domain-containing protein n=1 Tax=Paenibacillus lignilyticus TaxID=1172615 RepID=A0ABS5CGN5_9BACL|nr:MULTISPECIES: DUF4023 domain-containing protein [Paenibacillus]MBP3964972.1 DUF4023 domain-containing protein [Paenibacillus lignilyticus]SFT24536.1 Protein of unknown function [Paenibacillus sp. BC26]